MNIFCVQVLEKIVLDDSGVYLCILIAACFVSFLSWGFLFVRLLRPLYLRFSGVCMHMLEIVKLQIKYN